MTAVVGRFGGGIRGIAIRLALPWPAADVMLHCALLLSGNNARAFVRSLAFKAMPAYVSLAASPAVLVGDVPTTMAALTERVKLVLRLLCLICTRHRPRILTRVRSILRCSSLKTM